MKRSVTERAVAMLARREHSTHELTQKLLRAGFESSEIEITLERLQSSGLQSDERFAEAFIRSRAAKGYGSIRIKMELKERGVDSDIIDRYLRDANIDWFALAVEVRCKRFGEEQPHDFKERAKQQRFLQYRGFSHEQITESFELTNHEK